MVSKIFSAIPYGIESLIIEVECDVQNGLPATHIVGLPDTAVQESRERVKAAIKNSGASYPVSKVSINLAPADVPKSGVHLDMPIAIAILVSSGVVAFEVSDTLLVGEVALTGKLRPVPGVLAIAQRAQKLGFTKLFVPKENAQEASVVAGLEVFGFDTLEMLVKHIQGMQIISAEPQFTPPELSEVYVPVDFGNIFGHAQAKRALLIAAAGGHNISLVGPPGSGKSMLAKALGGIMPPLTLRESIEVTSIYSIAKQITHGLQTIRPFRNPHHTASHVSIVGGGQMAQPGEVTLAHRGILFLDEFPEFERRVLESLRQPLEERVVTVTRSKAVHTYPADFMLVAAQNPCPCGYYGDPERACSCLPSTIQNYHKKISGPLRDRIDLNIFVARIPLNILRRPASEEYSAVVRAKVINTRAIQKARFGDDKVNASMTAEEIRKFCVLDGETEDLLYQAAAQYHVSARQIYRLLRVARTIADLEQSEAIGLVHVSEALQYRRSEF